MSINRATLAMGTGSAKLNLAQCSQRARAGPSASWDDNINRGDNGNINVCLR